MLSKAHIKLYQLLYERRRTQFIHKFCANVFVMNSRKEYFRHILLLLLAVTRVEIMFKRGKKLLDMYGGDE